MTIAERIERINAECSGVWGLSDVTSWERERLNEWQFMTRLTPKQEEVLASIERKVFKGRSGGGL